jgi:hypothetical protein
VTSPVGAGEKISLRASPLISFAPANLTVRTSIEANADNRAMEIVIDSADFYRSSTVQLEGDRAPRTSIIEFRGVPGGTYTISARLFGRNGEALGAAHRTINVLAEGLE